MSLEYRLKDNRTPRPVIDDVGELEKKLGFLRIRCPECSWQPSADSRWRCDRQGSPEPLFDACGTIWNTFSTRGRCPGCSHQWIWTSCLRCYRFSLHDAWYETSEGEE